MRATMMTQSISITVWKRYNGYALQLRHETISNKTKRVNTNKQARIETEQAAFICNIVGERKYVVLV